MRTLLSGRSERLLAAHARPKERSSETLERLLSGMPFCTFCADTRLVNFEQASGWDEPCPKCTDPASKDQP